MINKTSILLIENDMKSLGEITEKCLEAGVSERNIFSVNETDSAERYLEIAGISYVIINADLYNFVVASTIEKFSAYFPIQVIITGATAEQKTLRMMNDKSLTFLNSLEELPHLLSGRNSGKVYYNFNN